MGVLVWWLAGDIDTWSQWNPRERALHLLGVIGAGVATYVAVLLAAGLRPRQLRAPKH
jgi:hypothetical protein